MSAALAWVRGRFARSVRLDASERVGQLDGYLPTARALEVVRRVMRGMAENGGARAFSITGPYGSGKSSLAVFLDALCMPEASKAHQAALALLAQHDPDTAALVPDARRAMGAGPAGLARAVVTAPQREPVAATVVRALHRAVEDLRIAVDVREALDDALERATTDRFATPSYREIRRLLDVVAAKRPVLVVIDEFGKNLEAYSQSGAAGDLYLLQELAEWAADGSVPMLLVTIQHLAFETYAADATVAERREWAKVQGRFEDIPFVDSSAATRSLIRVALEHADDVPFTRRRHDVAARAAAAADELGLPEVVDAELLAGCWPLHPTTLLVLPDLCSRYGQNERTLFSFLASREPLSVTSWLDDVQTDDDLDWVRLHRVYDYFVESASTFVGLAGDASRWMEVETAIRDVHGLTDAQTRVLKSIGVLNLIAATGTVRASADVIAFACEDGRDGTDGKDAVLARLDELCELGVLTHRDYADEYRIWRGSDYDLPSALTIARRQLHGQPVAALLEKVRPMDPLVAARHSTVTGTVRAFERRYADATTTRLEVPRPSSVCDGLLVHELDDAPLVLDDDELVPVVVVSTSRADQVVAAAVEVAALLQVADDPTLPADDHAAQREIRERLAHATATLDHELADAFEGSAASWRWLNPTDGAGTVELTTGIGTDHLSRVFDRVFSRGPSRVLYEAINRSELTSAGSRARATVLEALVDATTHDKPHLGLEGSGADVATYQAVLADSGIHDPFGGLSRPENDWAGPWHRVLDELEQADAAVTVAYLLELMMAPPYGLRQGTASVLLLALLVVEASDLALYEHGTFSPRISAPFVERLVRNPQNFAVKHLAAANPRTLRHRSLNALHDALDGLEAAPTRPERVSLLTTVQRFADLWRMSQSPYAASTSTFHGVEDVDEGLAVRAAAIRDALTTATEPDVLLFRDLPKAVGRPPLERGAEGMRGDDLQDFADEVAEASALVAAANDRQIKLIFHTIRRATVAVLADGSNVDDDAAVIQLVAMAERLVGIESLTPDVRAFQQACLMRPSTPIELATQVATTVTHTAPSDWDDATTARHVRHLGEVARAFRRVVDLVDLRARHDDGDRSFTAYAIALVSQAGHTVEHTVKVDHDDREQLHDTIEQAIDALATTPGRAVELLLAGLASRLVGDTDPTFTASTEEEERTHG